MHYSGRGCETGWTGGNWHERKAEKQGGDAAQRTGELESVRGHHETLHGDFSYDVEPWLVYEGNAQKNGKL